MDKGKKQELKQAYEKACLDYADALISAWELNRNDVWWVNDTPCCGTFMFGDIYALNIDELIFVVENDVSYDTYLQWLDYFTKCSEYNFNYPSLKSFVKGVPLIPQETFDKLDKLKLDFEVAIKDVKDKF